MAGAGSLRSKTMSRPATSPMSRAMPATSPMSKPDLLLFGAACWLGGRAGIVLSGVDAEHLHDFEGEVLCLVNDEHNLAACVNAFEQNVVHVVE